jgi:hypothetical protein
MPKWIVVCDRWITWAMSNIPSRGRKLVSAAAHILQPRSFRRLRSTRYLFYITANLLTGKEHIFFFDQVNDLDPIGHSFT